MATNLLQERWIPVRHASGRVSKISPHEITSSGADPIVDLAFARPDFKGSIAQFLIGLLQTACAPKTETEWKRWYRRPPEPSELEVSFAPFREAFFIDGDGPRFMQDFDRAMESDPFEPHRLLMDHASFHYFPFHSRWKFCLPCAATALFTLQLNAPEGGSGHYTSLRGGGPLTVLAVGETLWKTMWLNVLTEATFYPANAQLRSACDASVFPWLGPTRFGPELSPVTPQDVSLLTAFWATPRRIRLIVSNDEAANVCALCAESTSNFVSSYLMKSRGTNYENPPWQHPLSPHYYDKSRALRARHPSPAIGGYGAWAGIVVSRENDIPSLNVATLRGTRGDDITESLRLWVFGYQTDHMAVDRWLDSRMPFLRVPSEYTREYDDLLVSLIACTEYAAQSLYKAVKQALFSEDTTVRGDLSQPKQALWDRTESAFFEFLANSLEPISNGTLDRTSVLEGWITTVRRASQQVFSDFVDGEALEGINPKNVFVAQRRLNNTIAISAPKLRALLTLPALDLDKSENEKSRKKKTTQKETV